MSSQYNSDLTADMARLGEPSSVEENNRLHALVAAGDADARRRMIEGNMPLVVAKVDSFLAEFPNLTYLRDDLTSAGFVALVQAVNKIAEGKVRTNANGYIGVSINAAVGHLLEDESPIQVSHGDRQRAKAKGEEIEVPAVANKMPDHCRLPIAPQAQKVQARDLLRSCCKDDMERQILRLCESGCTYRQIAAQVPYKKSQIGNIVNRIEADYCQKRGLRCRQEQA